MPDSKNYTKFVFKPPIETFEDDQILKTPNELGITVPRFWGRDPQNPDRYPGKTGAEVWRKSDDSGKKIVRDTGEEGDDKSINEIVECRWRRTKANNLKPKDKVWNPHHHIHHQLLKNRLVSIMGKINEVVDDYNQLKEEHLELRADHDALEEEHNALEKIVTVNAAFTAKHRFRPHGTSDRRLKEDIKVIGKSPSGLNIYQFRFKDSYRYGDGLYQGVMSDEVSPSIVTQDRQGYDMVDYNQIDVDFKSVSE